MLNSKCEAIRALAAVKDPELQKLLAKQYFDIARMSTRPLENEELSAFIRQSYQLAARLAEKEGVPLLASIPLDPAFLKSCDFGELPAGLEKSSAVRGELDKVVRAVAAE